MHLRTAPISATAARNLTLDSEPWFSCDDCFDTVDVALEQLLDHAVPFTGPFRTHLLACVACRREARSLLGLLVLDRALKAMQTLTRFERELVT